MWNCKLILCLMVLMFWVSSPAQAYIGPGAGLGTIAVVLGILAAIVMAFFSILWYPVKRMLRKRQAARGAAKGDDKQTSGDTGAS